MPDLQDQLTITLHDHYAIQREIDSLHLKRKDVETSIEATIQTLGHTLDFVHDQDVRAHDDRVLHALTA